jgi:serine/threonine-protein kinase
MHLPLAQLDPLEVGQKLLVRWVLTGNFIRSEKGFDLNWQLLDVSRQSVSGGGAISVLSFDLVAVQTEICNEVFASLQGIGQITQTNERSGAPRTTLTEKISEEYLQARAMLSSFMQRTGSKVDLDRARELFDRVVQSNSAFAPAWSGLGITHLQYVRHGFGGHMHVMAARRALDQALDLDPGSVEANLYRVYMLI